MREVSRSSDPLPSTVGNVLQELMEVADAAIAAVDGERATAAALAEPSLAAALAGAERVFAVSVGKVAPAMHRAVTGAAPELAGAIVVGHEPTAEVDGATYHAGGHPAPTASSAAAGRAVLDFLAAAQLTPWDLVVFSVSGAQ